MTDVACPVCHMEFPEEQAEGLGAFKVEHDGKTYWLDSSTCVDAFRRTPGKFVLRAAKREP